MPKHNKADQGIAKARRGAEKTSTENAMTGRCRTKEKKNLEGKKRGREPEGKKTTSLKSYNPRSAEKNRLAGQPGEELPVVYSAVEGDAGSALRKRSKGG